MLPDHLPDIDTALSERIAEAIRRHYPRLVGADGMPTAVDLAVTAVLTVQETLTGRAAGRCIPLLRPHAWTRWELLKVPSPRFLIQEERQQRECQRCGRIQRAKLEVVL